MPDCFAKGCKSRRSQGRKNKIQLEWEQIRGKKITFHRVPKEPQKRKKWLDKMQLDESDVPETASLCSLHFEEKDLDRTSLACTRLRADAVPFGNSRNEVSPLKRQKIMEDHSYYSVSQNNNDSDQLKIEEIEIDEEKETIEYSNNSSDCTDVSGPAELKIATISTSCQDIFNHSSDCTDVSETSELKIASINSSCHNIFNHSSDCTYVPKTAEVKITTISTSCQVSQEDFCTPNSPEAVNQTLRTALINTRKEFQRKIKVLQQKQRRTMQYVERLKSILNAVKKKYDLDAQQLDILRDIG